MTADANPLTAPAIGRVQDAPPTLATQFRAWIDAFERLGYDVDRLSRRSAWHGLTVPIPTG
jgi:hypothetical protein